MARSLRPALPLALAALALLLAAVPAPAVIKKLTPLKDVLEGEELIFAAEVEKVDPAKPSVVFKFAENLKGKAPFDRIPANLTGDTESKRSGHTKVMLDRLAPGRKLVFFVSKDGDAYSAFGFLEGTWFQMRGTKDGDAVRWAFLHCEPYFRRTFKGTTEELRTTVAECLAGKRKPPEPDEKEPPGFGPPVEKKCGMRNSECGMEGKGALAIGDSAFPVPHSALFAVIPSFVLIGPLAVVAALFPGVFARMAVAMRRWRAFLVVASTNSTLALAYYFLREYLPNARWFGPQAFALLLLAITGTGLVWAGRRYRRSAAEEPAVTDPPSRKELLALAGLTAAVGLLVVGTGLFAGWGEAVFPNGYSVGGQAASGIGKEFTAIGVGLVAATVYAGYRAATRSLDEGSAHPVRLSLSGEAVGLGALFAFGVLMLTLTWPRERELTVAGGDGGEGGEVRVLFETPDVHEVMSSVTADGDRLYFGAAKTTGFRSSGAVFCVDKSGSEVWRFTDGGGLKPVFATPAVAGGQVFAGEGLHTDSDRRLFRLDAATGKPSWKEPVATASHTEGSPRVVNGKVYFSAGDDGLFCVSAADGAEVWHLKGAEQKLHVDTPPAVANGRVFAGSGYRTLALLCLDAEKGTEVWRTPVNLRSFGAPLVLGDRVVFGLGTGNLSEDLSTEPEEGVPAETQPAGAVVCVDAATGKEVWRAELPKSVHTPLAAGARSVYAACRDGNVYAIDRQTGKVRWRRSLGAPLTAGPAVALADGGAVALYAVTQAGVFASLHPQTGVVVWSRDLRGTAGGRGVQVLSTPTVAPAADGRRHVYFGAMLTNRDNGAKAAALFRVEEAAGE